MSNRAIFLTLVLIHFNTTFWSKELLNTDELVINSLAEQLTQNQVQEVLNFQNKWQWLSYAIIPLLPLLKISIIAGNFRCKLFLF